MPVSARALREQIQVAITNTSTGQNVISPVVVNKFDDQTFNDVIDNEILAAGLQVITVDLTPFGGTDPTFLYIDADLPVSVTINGGVAITLTTRLLLEGTFTALVITIGAVDTNVRYILASA